MAIDELHAYWSTSETYDYRFDELLDLQPAAADERLRSSRETIRVLDRREDLIPLLFSHTTYKSYPQAFVRQ